jgi:hypothetical protein
MKLNTTSAVKILKEPRFSNQIAKVKDQESQLRVFTEDFSKHELSHEPYWQRLMETLKARSTKKFDRVLKFSRFPLPVVQLSDSILNDFFKVFDGKNRFFNVEGDRNIEALERWIQENKPEEWIERHAMDVFKNKPNSFVVLDRNDEGVPYLIMIDSSRIHDAMFKDESGSLEYIAFIHSQTIENIGGKDVVTTFYSVYDDESFFVFSKKDNSDDFVFVSETKHNIGWCPARSFVREQSNSRNPFARRVAFTSALSKMEDWTIFDIFRNYMDHYAPFPVTEAPAKKCGNPQCVDGSVPEEVIVDPQNDITKTVWHKCDVCGGRDEGQHIGPGTHIGINVKPDQQKDGSGVFKMIFPETDKLKYIPEKLDDLELEIKLKTVGVNGITNSEAVNELQMKGSFASMETILIRTKSQMDHLYHWIVNTVGSMYYQNLNLKIEANFGTEFYLVSEDDLQKRFENAKKIGLPLEEQLNIYKQLIQTKYKGNSTKLNRSLMLLDLDPFPMSSVQEVADLRAKNAIDEFEFSMKVNFLQFISKFEAENVDITQFGINLEYWSRVERIKKELFLYNTELIEQRGERGPNPNPNPNPIDDGE